MSDQKHIEKLLASLALEIGGASAGSDQGQFPILDLLGNLRDSAAGDAALATLHATCAAAWEKVVTIVESGKPFDIPNQPLVPAIAPPIQLPKVFMA